MKNLLSARKLNDTWENLAVTIGISRSLRMLQFYLLSRPPREVLVMICCKISQESVGGSGSPRTPSFSNRNESY